MGEQAKSGYRDNKAWGWYRTELDIWRRLVASEHPVKVLEIGAFDGVSANSMLDFIFTHPESTVDTVDPYLPDPTTPEVCKETRSIFLENHRLGGHGNRIRLHEGRSIDVLASMIAKGMKSQFDVIFIDGSHFCRDVLTDAILSWPLLRPGGMLIFDDYTWGMDRPPYLRPKEAIDAFECAHRQALIPIWSGTQKIYRTVAGPDQVKAAGADRPFEGTCAIVGTFDSGSSMLSSIMESLGFHIGRPAWEPHYESDALRTILVNAWDEPNLVRTGDSQVLVRQLKGWHTEARRTSTAICAKHPLLCLSLPEIERAWGPSVVYIRARRTLHDSISGLVRRGWFPNPDMMQRKLHAAMESFFEGGTKSIDVEFDAIRENPVREIELLAERVGIAANSAAIHKAARLIESNGKH
jgi:predicted O-methyltransferase YrrM